MFTRIKEECEKFIIDLKNVRTNTSLLRCVYKS